MDIKEFVNLFADQFMDPNETVFAPETKFHELSGWTSMTALLEIAMIEDNFGTTIPSEVIRSSSTIQDLFDAILKSKGDA